MARKRNRPSVPGVFRRIFGCRARTLMETILSSVPPAPALCRCGGGGCLGCAHDSKSYLLRPEDPSEYRKLLEKCFVVVARDAPDVPFFFAHSSRLCQLKILQKAIDSMQLPGKPSNVLRSDIEWGECSSPNVELLSCASWCLLLSRVGDYFMFYLLQNTAIFLPAPHGKHHQVAGPPISDLCFNKLKGSLKIHDQKYGEQKRKRADADDPTVKKQKCHNSNSTLDPLGFSSNLDLTSKSSMQLVRHHGSRNYDVSVSEVPKSTRTGTVIRKLESEGKQGSNCITPRLGKRSRPFRSQRQSGKMQKQLNLKENGLNTYCNVLTTNSDCLPASFQPNTTSLSYHEKLQHPWQCSCCIILQSLPAVPKMTDIKRLSIFYNLESSHAVLPRKHILCSSNPNFACSKRLIEDIFGFSSAHPIPCLHSNGSCLIDSGCLYHSLVKWFKHLIRRTQCCKHTRLLNKHCVIPSLDLDKNTIGRSSSRQKDNVLETNVHRKNQEFGTKCCANTVEAIDSQSEAFNFKSFCSKSQVVSFIWAASRSLLPSELLGTPSTWRIMVRNISKFIHCRRFEKFPLKLCMHGLKISSFPFLSNKYCLNSQSACVLKNIDGVKCKLLEKWIFWYFSFLVVPLVQANFYVTETEQGKHDIYYYPKPVWEKLAASTIACFGDSRYSHMDVVEVRKILSDRLFGFSKLRLQPKENGARVFANLNRSSRMPPLMSTTGVQNRKTKGNVKQHLSSKKFQPVNTVLCDAHIILKGILLKEPNKLGSSVFDYNDVYKKLCPFFVGQKKGSASMPNLFIVKSDVSKAFDSIDQSKLLDIMKDFLLQDMYFLKRYDQVVCTKKSLWVQKQYTMLDVNGHTRFTSSFHSQHGVFVNQEQWRCVQKKAIYADLMEHVKRNLLKFDGKFYLQGVGIPQGGILSSLLCSMYYGHLERHVIFPFLEKTLQSSNCKENNAGLTNCDDKVSSSSSYILMRFLDDFLFISTSKKQAACFYSRLERGFKGYNCYMNEKKFGANFDVEKISSDSQLNRVYVGEDGATSFLPWSGLLINCSTMEIQADYTKYLGNHLSSTLTVCWQGKPGSNLKEKLRLFLRPKCHPIFFDSNINSAAVVRLNIYQMFLLCAMKFHCCIRDLSFVFKLPHRFCSNIIQSSLRYLHMLIKKHMHSLSLHSDVKPILELEREEVEWLGLHAYIQVLKRKQSRHKKLLTVLKSRMSSHRMSERVSPELKYAIDAKNSSLLWNIKY